MTDLLSLNVNNHIEKKNGQRYLSWAWAWAEVLKADPAATWEPIYWNGSILLSLPDGTAFVGARVTLNSIARQCVLPVMDNRNKAIQNPDAFAVNKNLMRALAKAIAMHGLGLYIFAGEDMPEDDDSAYGAFEAQHLQTLRDAAQGGLDKLKTAFDAIPQSDFKMKLWTTHSASLKKAASK